MLGCKRHPTFDIHANRKCFSSNDLARMSNKKTISPQDVMSALKDAELEGFLPRLEAELKSRFYLNSHHHCKSRPTDMAQSTTTLNATSVTHTAIA